MKYTFGPIPSRRFGLSLGIDLSPNTKQCNFDCLYCELKPAKTTDIYSDVVNPLEIINEIKEVIQNHNKIDVITITANGEPTLYPKLNQLVDELKNLNLDTKLLILSNASTVVEVNIQKILSKFDIVKLSLDCATQKCLNKIDRPHDGINVEDIIDAIENFKTIYSKELVLEVLVVENINDNEDEMNSLSKAINKIKPSRVDLGTIDRPPAYNVKGVSYEKLKELKSFIDYENILITTKKENKNKETLTKEEILKTIERRPISDENLKNDYTKEVSENIKNLLNDHKIVAVNIEGKIFYKKSEKNSKNY